MEQIQRPDVERTASQVDPRGRGGFDVHAPL
jgi:hypothetical protein